MACEICNKQYVPSTEENDDGKPHVCTTCGKGFSLKIQLKRHMVIHENGMSFVCIDCEKNPDSQSYNLRVTKKNIYTCKKCNRDFKTKRLLLRHSCEHALINCDKCDDSFMTVAELLKHSAVHKGKKSREDDLLSYFCIDCNKSFLNSYLFEKHKASHKRFMCESCHANFTSKEGLYNHSVAGCRKEINVSKEADTKKHICDICDKSFARKSTLDGHVLSHFEDKTMESGVEDVSDIDADFLCDEKKMLTKQPKEMCLPKLKIKRSFQCEICEKKLTSKKMLDNHLLSHNTILQEPESKEQKKYTCRTCNEIFLSKMEYKKHKLTHDSKYFDDTIKIEVKKYKCKTCGETFAKKKRFKKHTKKHFPEAKKFSEKGKRRKRSKDHACDSCGKRFSGKYCLLKHTAKCHSGTSTPPDNPVSKEKKVKKPQDSTCPYCNADFVGRKYALAKHKLTHTPEVCGICEARFEDRPALREHLKTHLGTEEAKKFVECSQKAQNVKNNINNTEGKVEYIYLVLR